MPPVLSGGEEREGGLNVAAVTAQAVRSAATGQAARKKQKATIKDIGRTSDDGSDGDLPAQTVKCNKQAPVGLDRA